MSYRSFWMLEAIPERRYIPSTTPCFSMNSVQLLSTWGTRGLDKMLLEHPFLARKVWDLSKCQWDRMPDFCAVNFEFCKLPETGDRPERQITSRCSSCISRVYSFTFAPVALDKFQNSNVTLQCSPSGITVTNNPDWPLVLTNFIWQMSESKSLRGSCSSTFLTLQSEPQNPQKRKKIVSQSHLKNH